MNMIPKVLVSEAQRMHFCAFLADSMGIYFPKERWTALEKKLQAAMHFFNYSDLSLFLEWLMKEPLSSQQIDVLAYYLTVGETYFFRDSRMFSLLEKQILLQILKRCEKERVLRIWSAGCCTGEEPYSLAILLHRILPAIKTWDLCILGSDLNREFLKKAEQAQYRSWSLRATPQEIIKKYFIKEGDYFQLIPEIRNMVKFSYINLVQEKPISFGEPLFISTLEGTKKDSSMSLLRQGKKIDLILCHNVLIYFSKNQVQKSIKYLTDALDIGGWLSVAAIEVPFVQEQRLLSVPLEGATFFKKIDAISQKMPSKSISELESLPAKLSSVSLNLPDTIVPELSYQKSLELYKKKQYQLALNSLLPLLEENRELSTKKAGAKECILLAKIYANQGALLQALQWCERAIKIDPLNPLSHYLLATIYQADGAISEALEALKHALFLEPHFPLAHYMAGIMQKKSGNKKAAHKAFTTAYRLLGRAKLEELLFGSEELTAAQLKDLILIEGEVL